MTAIDDSQVFDRMPPNDIETERCALGAAMVSPDAALTLVEELGAGDFFRPAHQTVFAAIDSLTSRSEVVNPVSVLGELETLRDGKRHIPDGLYLHSMIEGTPVAASASYFCRRLRGLRNLRGLAVAGPSISQLGYGSAVDDVDHALEMAHKILDEATAVASKSTAASVADLITPFLESLERTDEITGLSTGWVDVDSVLSGLRPGQLITIGARPAMGKTMIMVNAAYHVGVKLGLPVWIGTLEMSANELMARVVARDARVPLKALIEKNLSDADWERLRQSHARLSEAGNFIIDDEPGMGISHIRTGLRNMRRAGRPAALAIVDYIQLMSSNARVENRQTEVSQFSRSLKLLAKELRMPIVIGSQLNRNVEQRADKRPTMADLRESGALEQDSDVVVLLYREDAYDPESPRAGELDFIVAKNRSGPVATVTLAFQGHYSRISDMAKPDWSPTGALS
jgi:replicative DNA helicase